MKSKFSFSFLRYHHDLLSGEFVNIGMLSYLPDINRNVIFHYDLMTERMKQFFGDTFDQVAVGDYEEMMESISESCYHLKFSLDDGPDILDNYSAKDIGQMFVPIGETMQWSESGGGLTDDIEESIRDLYQKFIGKYN